MANKGKKLTEEHKAKIVGWGRKQPERQKELVADANSMKWLVHNLSTGKKELGTYASMVERIILELLGKVTLAGTDIAKDIK